MLLESEGGNQNHPQNSDYIFGNNTLLNDQVVAETIHFNGLTFDLNISRYLPREA